MSDTIYTLPSGPELSVDAARGDLKRAASFLLAFHAQNTDALAADLQNIADFLTMLELPEYLQQDIEDALSGDSNDLEHDALVSVAQHFGIEWTDLDDVLNDE